MTRTEATVPAVLLLIATLGSPGCAGVDPIAGSAAPPGPVAQRSVAELTVGDHPPSATDAQPTSAAPSDAQTVSVPMAGTDLVRGRSTIKVAAPIEKVREAVMAFSSYPDFMPHYRKAKVLGRSPSGGKDVYMEVEALNGAATMWARIDVPKAAMVDGVETYDTKFLQGNVKEFKAIWRLKTLDEATTELSLEVFMHPLLPLPSGLLNGENVKGATAGVTAMRARIEGRVKAP